MGEHCRTYQVNEQNIPTLETEAKISTMFYRTLDAEFGGLSCPSDTRSTSVEPSNLSCGGQISQTRRRAMSVSSLDYLEVSRSNYARNLKPSWYQHFLGSRSYYYPSKLYHDYHTRPYSKQYREYDDYQSRSYNYNYFKEDDNYYTRSYNYYKEYDNYQSRLYNYDRKYDSYPTRSYNYDRKYDTCQTRSYKYPPTPPYYHYYYSPEDDYYYSYYTPQPLSNYYSSSKYSDYLSSIARNIIRTSKYRYTHRLSNIEPSLSYKCGDGYNYHGMGY